MTRRMLRITVELVEEHDGPAPIDTDGAELDEDSGVFRALPKRSLAKCGDVRRLAEKLKEAL